MTPTLNKRFFRMQHLLGRHYVFESIDDATRAQVLVIDTMLRLKQDERPVTVSNLAERLNISIPAMSRRVHGLVEQGWIERLPDPTDRRTQHLTITPLGRKQYRNVQKKVGALMREILAGYSTDEIEDFIDMGTDIGHRMREVTERNKEVERQEALEQSE